MSSMELNPAKSQFQNFFEHRRSFRGIQHSGSNISPEILKSMIGANSACTESQTRSSSPENASVSLPLTIFYNGTVSVFDLPRDKAEMIMRLAEEGNMKNNLVDHKVKMSSDEHDKLMEKLNGDLPIARKKSLQRFLEKRKERSIPLYSAANYNTPMPQIHRSFKFSSTYVANSNVPCLQNPQVGFSPPTSSNHLFTTQQDEREEKDQLDDEEEAIYDEMHAVIDKWDKFHQDREEELRKEDEESIWQQEEANRQMYASSSTAGATTTISDGCKTIPNNIICRLYATITGQYKYGKTRIFFSIFFLPNSPITIPYKPIFHTSYHDQQLPYLSIIYLYPTSSTGIIHPIQSQPSSARKPCYPSNRKSSVSSAYLDPLQYYQSYPSFPKSNSRPRTSKPRSHFHPIT